MKPIARSRRHKLELPLGVVLTAACALASYRSPEIFGGAWLAAWLFAMALPLGALSALLMAQLAGGAWVGALQPALQAIARRLPWMLLLALPLLPSLHGLYPWISGDIADGQRWWFAPGFAITRLLLCCALWLWLMARLTRAHGMRRSLAVVAALLQLLAITVFAFDALMSLQPAFRSASFGLELLTSQMLAAMALTLLLAGRLHGRIARTAYGVLVMASLLWMYLHFMAYLTAWSADLPAEILWYQPRTQTSWGVFIAIGFVLQGLLPLFGLLLPSLREGRGQRAIASLVLIGSVAFWQADVGAALHPGGLVFGIAQLAALMLMLLYWLALALFALDGLRVAAPPQIAPHRRKPAAYRAKRSTEEAADEQLQAESDAKAEPHRDIEPWQIPGRPFAGFGIAFTVGLTLILLASFVYWRFLFVAADAPSQIAANQLPPQPRLQTHAPSDRAAEVASQRARLNGYEWIDRDAGIARIPIDRAMALQAERMESAQ
jgi:hypothetical protein